MADAPITQLEVIQRGKEVTAGTLVAATHRVPLDSGTVEFDPTIDPIVRRYSGSAATSHLFATGLVHAAARWEEAATFDFLAVMLEACLGPAVITGAGANKTWTFLPSDGNPNNLVRHSLEFGGRDTWPEEEKLAGSIISSLTIEWNKADIWKCSVEYMGMRNTQAAKTSLIALPAALVPIIGKSNFAYIDASTFGSTLRARVLSGKIVIEPEISERFGSDGNDYANRLAVKGRKVSGSVVLEYDATTDRAAWRAGTLQKIRVANTGPTLGSGTYSAAFDIPGTWQSSVIGDDDGIITLECDLLAQYNATLGSDLGVVIVNSLAAVP